MKKTIYLPILFFLITTFIYAQQPGNVQVYASSRLVEGNMPTDPDFYQWGQIENSLQRINIDITLRI